MDGLLWHRACPSVCTGHSPYAQSSMLSPISSPCPSEDIWAPRNAVRHLAPSGEAQTFPTKN
jgi:hypothetical protein